MIGYVTEETGSTEKNGTETAFKISVNSKVVRPPDVYGDLKSEIALTCFGSTVRAVLDALESIVYCQWKISETSSFYLVFFRFPTESVTELLSDVKTIIDGEQKWYIPTCFTHT